MILLADMNNITFRNFAAMQELSHNGMKTGAIFGSLKMLRECMLLKPHDPPKAVYAVWDGGWSDERTRLYPDYKANRTQVKEKAGLDIEDFHRQIQCLKCGLAALGIHNFRHDGVEADDMIALLADAVESAGESVIIMSTDKDFYQLLSERVSIWNGKRLYSERLFQNEFGLQPDQWPDVRALMGDHSDNIPGVRGVGEKTALKLVREFGSISNMICRSGAVSMTRLGRKVIEQRHDAILFRRLITLPLMGRAKLTRVRRMLAIGLSKGFKPNRLNPKGFFEFCLQYGLHSIFERRDNWLDLFSGREYGRDHRWIA